MISFNNISLEYQPGKFALQDVSFALEAGSFTFITGHSGAGKSSLLKLIARLVKPSAGNIQLGNISYSTLSTRQENALRQQMGIIFQDNQLLYDRTVFDNVALPLIIGGYRFSDIKTRVSAALDKVGLSNKATERPLTLSGGEQQRVGIARAVVAKPKLLLADEPTGNLDSNISQEIMKLLMHFNASGVTVLFATHDETVLRLANVERLELQGGEILSSQPSDGQPLHKTRLQNTDQNQRKRRDPSVATAGS
ncbi:MAG: cell division ATP-binding protein FtsE [Granulosicoccus sp.]|nr:cell division ATP-binding protein FtsE [Granulosicoccus sp.]